MSVHNEAFTAFKSNLAPAAPKFALSAAELSALMASRLCHDLISPVGAINNAMELYEDGLGDADALRLIHMSAANASARLQFARLAYGAAGSAGDSLSAAEAEKLARGYLGEDKLSLSWQAQIPYLSKNQARLLLNMTALAAASLPRGGQISVFIAEEQNQPRWLLRATGTNLRLPPAFIELYHGLMAKGNISAHNIQFYWTLLLSANENRPIALAQAENAIQFLA